LEAWHRKSENYLLKLELSPETRSQFTKIMEILIENSDVKYEFYTKLLYIGKIFFQTINQEKEKRKEKKRKEKKRKNQVITPAQTRL